MNNYKIAVIGGGIFGTTISWKLAKQGYKVDLFEKNDDIFKCASGINQYRLHRGYHYPRSVETVLSCIEGEKQFTEAYAGAVLKSNKHYYCISKENSLTSDIEFEKLCKNNGLDLKITSPKIINNNSISKSYEVHEYLFDPFKLKNLIKEKLKYYNVQLRLNREITREELSDYDAVVIATYSSNNQFFDNDNYVKKTFQFELCEKVVVKLPDQFKNSSVVIIDGPFMCIDPFGETGYHVMGNVVHAIHDSKIGYSYKTPDGYEHLVNNGVIKSPIITNYKDFIESASNYFYFLDDAIHIGSMFTSRVVFPYRDHDDARPTVVEKIDDKYITVFSGKIPTCINAAEEVLKIIEMNNSQGSI